jgi:UDP-glucose 4-epimerase
MKSILVTGGCGFIGTSLVTVLRDRGYSVKVLDNLSNVSDVARADSVTPWGQDVEVVQGDIRDSSVVRAAMGKIDTVVHLAAFGSVADSIGDPEGNFDVNVRGTLSVLQACVAQDVPQIIFASTGGALIGNVEPPVNEASLPWPISPYGASKLCCEAYLHAFSGSYGLSAVALRFANVYGPHSLHKKGAVTTFIMQALASEPLIIYGDGTASRDFLFVDDLCDGIAAAVGSNLVDEVIHLASGVETSIGELAELILDITDRPATSIDYLAPRRGEVARNFATAEKARALLQFSPRYSLRTGMERTVDWFVSAANSQTQWTDSPHGDAK